MWLTVPEAAAAMRVSPSTVYGMCGRQALRHVRVGQRRGVIRIPEEAVAEFLRDREVAPLRAAPPSRPQPPPLKLKHLRL